MAAHRLFPTDAELDEIIVGPESLAWRITSDVRLQLAMLYPLLLQVAHPTVAAGVLDHSDFERNPWKRLVRTVDYLCLLVYGGRDAVAAGRRLRALHGRFRGERADGVPYSALEPDAYAWVHATLLDTFVRAHSRFGRPLRGAEVERFYREYRALGRLIGVREGDLPASWAGFTAYFERTIDDTLVHTPAVEQVLRALRRLGPPPITMPAVVWQAVRLPARRALWVGGIGLLEPRLRRRLGLRWGAADEAQFRALGVASRCLEPVLPAAYKVTGPAQLRWRSEAIARGPLARN